MLNVKVADAEGVVCLPGDYGVNCTHTLCGWVDVPNEKTRAAATCNACLAIFKHVLTLAKTRGIERTSARASTIERVKIVSTL